MMDIEATQGCGELVLIDKDNMTGLSGHFPEKIILKSCRQIIGRSNKADIKLTAEKEGKFIISRSHAAITVHGDSLLAEIEDLGALNGMFVNSVRVKSAILKDNDILQFGGMSEVPVGKRLTGGDAAVRYVYRSPVSRNSLPHSVQNEYEKSSERESSSADVTVSGSKRGAESGDSKGKRVKLAVSTDAIHNLKLESSNHVGIQQKSLHPSIASSGSAQKHLQKAPQSSVVAHSDKIILQPHTVAQSVSPNLSHSVSEQSAPRSQVQTPHTSTSASRSMVENNLRVLNSNNGKVKNGGHVGKSSAIPSKSTLPSPLSADNLSFLLQNQHQQMQLLQQLQTQQEEYISQQLRQLSTGNEVLAVVAQLSAQVEQLSRQLQQPKADSPPTTEAPPITALPLRSLLDHARCVLCREVGVELCVMRCSHAACALCLGAFLCPYEPALENYRTASCSSVARNDKGSKDNAIKDLSCPACNVPLLAPSSSSTSSSYPTSAAEMPVAFRCAALDELAFQILQQQQQLHPNDESTALMMQRQEWRRAVLHQLLRGANDTSQEQPAVLSRQTRDTFARHLPLPEHLQTATDIQEENEQRLLQSKKKSHVDPSEVKGRIPLDSSDSTAAPNVAPLMRSEQDIVEQEQQCDYCAEHGHDVSHCPHAAIQQTLHQRYSDNENDGEDEVDRYEETEEDI